MGITELEELVKKGEPVSQQEIDAASAEHLENDTESRYVRSDVEQTFAEAREDIDAKYMKALATAAERRDNALSKNLKKRTDVLEKVGLNPNGSDPRGREQGVL